MDTSTETITPASQRNERPQFLSVLCILTWIMCGLTFLAIVWGVLTKPSEEEAYEQVEKMKKQFGPEAAAKMEEMLQKQAEGSGQLLNTLLSLVAVGLSAYGAYLMWQLRRTGFYFYVAGELLPYLSFMFAAEEMMAAFSMFGSTGTAAAGIFIGLMVVFDIVFIALYAANLKHMRQ